MDRTKSTPFKPGEVISRLVTKAKILTEKPMDNLTENLSNKSLSYMDEHYTVAKKEEIKGLVDLLKQQESYMNKLRDAVAVNDRNIKDIQHRLENQRLDIAEQVAVLRADSRACTVELKTVIENTGQIDYSAFEEAFRSSSDTLVSQQRAHTVEMDRMMMSLKTSVEKNIEKTKGYLESKIETTAGRGAGIYRMILLVTILNFLCLIGYIVYDLIG